MQRRLMLSAVIYPMVNAVLLGIGAIVILSCFGAAAKLLLPIIIISSFIISVPISWIIAPHLSLRLSGRA